MVLTFAAELHYNATEAASMKTHTKGCDVDASKSDAWADLSESDSSMSSCDLLSMSALNASESASDAFEVRTDRVDAAANDKALGLDLFVPSDDSDWEDSDDDAPARTRQRLHSSTRTRGSALDTSFRRSGRGEEDVEESDARVTVWRGQDARAVAAIAKPVLEALARRRRRHSGACAGSSAVGADINRVA